MVVHLSKGIWEQTKKGANDQSWNNLSNKINKIVLDYNPKYKISMSPS